MPLETVYFFLPFDRFRGTPQGLIVFADGTDPNAIHGGTLFHDKHSARELFICLLGRRPPIHRTQLPDFAPGFPRVSLDEFEARAMICLGRWAEHGVRDVGYLRFLRSSRSPRAVLLPCCMGKGVERLVIAGFLNNRGPLQGFCAIVSDPSDLPNVYRRFGRFPEAAKEEIRRESQGSFVGPKRQTIYVTGEMAQRCAVGADYWCYRQQGLVP